MNLKFGRDTENAESSTEDGIDFVVPSKGEVTTEGTASGEGVTVDQNKEGEAQVGDTVSSATEDATAGVDTDKEVARVEATQGTETGDVVNEDVTEEAVLKFLRENQGMEVESLDSLNNQTGEVEVDPLLKELSDWRERTNRPLEDWIKFQKDYESMSDLDIARESLRLEYPTLSEEQIDLEITNRFEADEYDTQDKAIKDLELAKYVQKGKEALKVLKSSYNEPSDKYLTKEQKEDLDYVASVKEQISNNERATDEYNQSIKEAANKIESIPLKLSNDLTIDFKVPSKETLPDMVSDMPHWHNEDGSWNHSAIIKDAAVIRNLDSIVQLAYEQGASAGTEDILKAASNSTLESRKTTGSELSSDSNKHEIEGLPKNLGMSFGRR